MIALSFDEAVRRYPDLTNHVMHKMAVVRKAAVDPSAIRWHSIVCHDDPDQPLDEAACADVMRTGRLPCRNGLVGNLDGHFVCVCSAGCDLVGNLR
jgi:hypothetical protein